jgi:riboflavin biosynthesis pyrimidine reductase
MAGRSEGLPLELIWQAAGGATQGAQVRGGRLPPQLAARYEGGLTVALRSDRPTVIANFVSSIDGVVALGTGMGSGGEISGFSEADRFMMALLRGLADVVLVGAGTARAGRRHEWTPRRLQPDLAEVFARWREKLGLAPQPTTIVVSASGNIDPSQPAFNAPDVPVIVVTTRAGASHLAQLAAPPPRNMAVEAAAYEGPIRAPALLDVIRRTGAQLALCEGGPHLFGDLVSAGLVDELFLTLAPQLIGRDESATRLALVEGAIVGEEGGKGRWVSLRSIRRAGDDLFLRYRFEP